MMLHLGGKYSVAPEEIIGIFDFDTASSQKATKAFLKNAQDSGSLRVVSNEIPRAFVLCGDGKSTAVYVTQISSATLKDRLDQPPAALNE